MTQIT